MCVRVCACVCGAFNERCVPRLFCVYGEVECANAGDLPCSYFLIAVGAELQSAVANALGYTLLHLPRDKIAGTLPRLEATCSVEALAGLINERVCAGALYSVHVYNMGPLQMPAKFRLGLLLLRTWSRGGGDCLRVFRSGAGLVKSFARLQQLLKKLRTPHQGGNRNPVAGSLADEENRDREEELGLAASGMWALGTALRDCEAASVAGVCGRRTCSGGRAGAPSLDDDYATSGRTLFAAAADDAHGSAIVTVTWDHSSTEILQTLLQKHRFSVAAALGVISTVANRSRDIFVDIAEGVGSSVCEDCCRYLEDARAQPGMWRAASSALAALCGIAAAEDLGFTSAKHNFCARVGPALFRRVCGLVLERHLCTMADVWRNLGCVVSSLAWHAACGELDDSCAVAIARMAQSSDAPCASYGVATMWVIAQPEAQRRQRRCF